MIDDGLGNFHDSINFQLPTPDEPRTMVRIVENLGDQAVRVPTNASDRLPLSAVTALFGDVVALKHEVHQVDGVGWDALLLEHGQFSPPQEGWLQTTFVTVKAKSSSSEHYLIKVE